MAGLVLEGGGVRGIYTAGVLDAFMEHSLAFDGVIGVSAGAIHAVSYLSGQKGRSIRYYTKYLKDPRFMSMQSFIKTGNVVGVDFCYHELPDKLDVYDHEAFLKNTTPFYAVVTNVASGLPEYIRVRDLREQIDYIRASASLPYFSKIVEIDGVGYLDGGCTDAIPIEVFRSMGYKRNVVVLTRDASYSKKAEPQLIRKLCYRKNPEFLAALEKRHIEYNRTLDVISELENKGEIFVIRPSEPLGIGRLEKNTEKLIDVYERGMKDAQRLMTDLKLWLDKK